MKATRSRAQLNTAAALACCWLAATYPLVAAQPLVVCAPGGTHIATVAEQGRIHYRQATDYTIQGTFYICHPQAICFSEDGKLLAAAGGRNGSRAKIKVWRIADHKELCEIITDRERFNALALSADGSLVVAASSDGCLAVWRVSDGQSQWSRTLASAAQWIQFSPDSKRLFVRAENRSERQFDEGPGRLVTASVSQK